MNWFLTLVTLIFFNSLFSQELKIYKGDYSNGTSSPGYAEFEYYENSGELIKNGNFRYTYKISNENGTYSAIINGKYKNGKKDGVWSYDVSYIDFRLNKSLTYATGFYKLTSNYIQGYPTGNWKYNHSNKTRNKLVNGWGSYDKPEESSVVLNFKNGLLVGEIKCINIMDNTYPFVDGQFDENGFAVGKWNLKRGNSDVEINRKKFYKNVLISDVSSSLSSGDILYKSELGTEDTVEIKKYIDNLITYNDLVEKNLKIDTINVIESKFLNFNNSVYNKHFLNEYISGDLCYNLRESIFENKGSNFIVVEKYVNTFNFDNTDVAQNLINLRLKKSENSKDYALVIKDLNTLLKIVNPLTNEQRKKINDKIIFCDSLRLEFLRKEIENNKIIDTVLNANSNNLTLIEIDKIIDIGNKFLKDFDEDDRYFGKRSEISNKINVLQSDKVKKKYNLKEQELIYFKNFSAKNQTKEKLLSDLDRVINMEKYCSEHHYNCPTEQEKFIFKDAKNTIEKALRKFE